MGRSKLKKTIITEIRSGKYSTIFEIPNNYRFDKDVLKVCVDSGMAWFGRRGYDVILGMFYCFICYKNSKDSSLVYSIPYFFKKVENYLELVGDSCYTEACYYGYEGSSELLDKDRLCMDCYCDESLGTFVDYCYKSSGFGRDDCDYEVIKAYNPVTSMFCVRVNILMGRFIAYCDEWSTKIFSEYVAFLGGDLSDCNLSDCTGFNDLSEDLKSILNLRNAKLVKSTLE